MTHVLTPVEERRSQDRSSLTRRLMAIGYIVAMLALFGVSAEMAARVQDWMTNGTAVTALPDSDRDLFIQTPSGRRGRPLGHYRKWVLNEYGFRSGPMPLEPAAGVTRIMVLGASESFGLYESPQHEFPAQLATRLRDGRYEVINAALTGQTLGSTLPYWTSWARRFRPSVVVIYPSPLFYLNNISSSPTPSITAASTPPVAAPTGPSSLGMTLLNQALGLRMLTRIRERVDIPLVIQRRRDERAINLALQGHPPNWEFSVVPRERVDLFMQHLRELVTVVRRDGARVIVMTHASRVTDPPRPDDWQWLSSARVRTLRATPSVIARFETITNKEIRAWAPGAGVEVIDLAAVMSGHGNLFGDLIHFNDDGARIVAETIATHILNADSPRQALSADRR